MTCRPAPLLLLAALISLALSRPAPAAEPPKPPTTQPLAALEKTLQGTRFDAVRLKDVIDYLRDESGANVYVRWAPLAAAGVAQTEPITLDADGATFARALDLTLKAAGADEPLAYATYDDVVVISTAADLKGGVRSRWLDDRGRDEPANAATVAALDRPLPEVRFDATKFGETIDFLRDVAGVPLSVNWPMLRPAKVEHASPITLRLRGARLSTVLTLVLDQLPADKPVAFVVEKDRTRGVIRINTEAELAKAK
jgi:hypothetical protein